MMERTNVATTNKVQRHETHTRAYTRFLELLDRRRLTAIEDPDFDIRSWMISNLSRTFNIGFSRKNIQNAFSANMPSMFNDLVAIDEPRFAEARNFLIYGALLDKEPLSHSSAMKIFPHIGHDDTSIFFEMGFLASCNSWSEAISQKSRKMACLGYVYDDLAHYYMANYQSRLNLRLNSAMNLAEHERLRARGLIDRIVERRISKYNSQPIRWPALDSSYKRKVLVVDQNFSDASNFYGRADATTFSTMLDTAVIENPDAEILVKTHPDLNWVKFGKRAGYFDHLQSSGRIRVLREAVNPFCLFDLVDKVYVGTSGMGLEALLAGKPVVCFGAPFYSGWGLTDDRQVIPHRHRTRSLEEIFYLFYVWYTIYHVPGLDAPCEIEDVLEYIEANRPISGPPPRLAPTTAPRLSIVVPVYNVARYIEQCLDSISAQDFGDYEVLIVNDASTDTSQSIIDQKALHDPRIHIEELEKNIGPGFARNVALKKARGDYVIFIDPDDYMPDPGHLSRMIVVADFDKVDMIRYRKAFEQVENENGEIIECRQDPTERFFNNAFHAELFHDQPRIAHSRHFWNWMYRRELLADNCIKFTTTYREERAFLLSAYLKAERVSAIPSDGVVYRIRRDSAMRRAQTASDIKDQVDNFASVVALLAHSDGFRFGSPLNYYARFQVSQFLHYLIFGFAYKTARTEPDPAALQDFLTRLGEILRSTGLTGADLVAEPVQLSPRHVRSGAYGLLFEALCSSQHDFVSKAHTLSPVPLERLHQATLEEPKDDLESRFQAALNRYARNDLVAASDVVPTAGVKDHEVRPRILIHIGSTKTGSTFLQHLMEKNRPALLRQGIWYPEVGLYWQETRPHKQAGHANFANAAISGDISLRQYLEQGLRDISSHVHTIVLSSEAFFLMKEAPRLAKYFDGYPVEMIVYLRRQDDWANAQYIEFVSGGAVNRISQRLDDWLDSEVTRDRLDYLALLERWEAVMGIRNITVRIYDRTRFEDSDLVSDFADATGLEPLCQLPLPEKGLENRVVLSTSHVNVIRHFNGLRFPGRAAYFSFIQNVADEISTVRSNGGRTFTKPNVLTVAQRRRILETAKVNNAEIARRYFDRNDGQLFYLPEKLSEPVEESLPDEEFDIICRLYEVHSKVASSSRNGRIKLVNYGLFGWRLWGLAPIVRYRLQARGSERQLADFDLEPATFMHGMRDIRHRRLASFLFPQGSTFGPFEILSFWIPLLERVARRRYGNEAAAQIARDPIVYLRRHPTKWRRILGRIIFPIGELRGFGLNAKS